MSVSESVINVPPLLRLPFQQSLDVQRQPPLSTTAGTAKLHRHRHRLGSCCSEVHSKTRSRLRRVDVKPGASVSGSSRFSPRCPCLPPCPRQPECNRHRPIGTALGSCCKSVSTRRRGAAFEASTHAVWLGSSIQTRRIASRASTSVAVSFQLDVLSQVGSPRRTGDCVSTVRQVISFGNRFCRNHGRYR